MRSLDGALLAHLASRATTLCWCWRVTRTDGTKLGFTDHDRDLVFDGTSFEAATGFTATEIAGAVGLNVDTLDVESAITSDRLSEGDLSAGLFDNALVEIFRVNWADTDQRVLMRYGNLGEVTRGTVNFKAEVRGLAHELQQPKGRVIQFACDADLGDARCTINLDDPAFKGTGTVTAVSDPAGVFAASGLDDFDQDWFTRGLLTWTGGANDGVRQEVKLHSKSGGVSIELWNSAPNDVAIADTFTVTAGCDKSDKTCRVKFDNIVNFRGFPDVPGVDFALTVPDRGKNNDGESMN